MNPIDVAIFGPNLRDQSKGEFHIHAADCHDCGNYGPNKKFGGDESMVLDTISRAEVVHFIYADQLAEGASTKLCAKQVYFAPCLKELPK